MIEGKVIINVYPEGSRIYIDNFFMGLSPLTLTLPVEKYKGEAKKEGCVSREWVVEVREDSPPNEYFFALKCSPEVYSLEG
jgi:hypothetical protein